MLGGVLGVVADRGGFDGKRIAIGYGGAVFFLAGLGRPRWLFDVVRSASWFALLPDLAIRTLLVLFGILFLLAGFGWLPL